MAPKMARRRGMGFQPSARIARDNLEHCVRFAESNEVLGDPFGGRDDVRAWVRGDAGRAGLFHLAALGRSTVDRRLAQGGAATAHPGDSGSSLVRLRLFLLWCAYAFADQSNLWPVPFLLFAPFGTIYLVILLIVAKARERSVLPDRSA
jgi:hypothetical protein